MDWNAIGAIGEVAGAVGVIATLLYLSLQIRSSARATESRVHVDLSSEMERLMTTLATDDGLADAMLAAQTNAELSPRQRMKLLYWFAGFMRVCESHLIQRRLEATSVDLETPIRNILRRFARVPELRRLMESGVASQTATPEFLAWLDSEVLAEPAGEE